VVDVLNDLIETSKDGEYGFTTCAERATSVELKETFLRRASDCARAASALQALVVEYGGKAEDSGTVAGAVHRGWVSVRDALSGTTDQAILDECERGEDVALSRYRKAMRREELPPAVRQVVERQMAGGGLRSTSDRFSNLTNSRCT
jgi:uncharacterized protein (TIGR02284 family)